MTSAGRRTPRRHEGDGELLAGGELGQDTLALDGPRLKVALVFLGIGLVDCWRDENIQHLTLAFATCADELAVEAEVASTVLGAGLVGVLALSMANCDAITC